MKKFKKRRDMRKIVLKEKILSGAYRLEGEETRDRKYTKESTAIIHL